MPRSLPKGEKSGVQLFVVRGNALAQPGDVLILKFAQSLYGVDSAAFYALDEAGVKIDLPKESEFFLTTSRGAIGCSSVLFAGVEELHRFGYSQIREFARSSLALLAEKAPDIEHVVVTIHGPGYGLDELEAFTNQVAGIAEAVLEGRSPRSLRTITFVELDPRRADRLAKTLRELLPDGALISTSSTTSRASRAAEKLRSAESESATKPSIFVAMPFAEEMDDVYYFGIEGAVKAAGFLCERADLSSFTGDILDWVKQRIRDSQLVIADLSDANPNVYLEVGYAWGYEKPTILLARHTEKPRFNVRGQRCLVYKRIKDLEQALTKELQALRRTLEAGD
jgi:hypothetical protein